MTPDDLQQLLEGRKEYEKAYDNFLRPGTERERLMRGQYLGETLTDYCNRIAHVVGHRQSLKQYLVKIGKQTIEEWRVDWKIALAKTTVNSIQHAAKFAIEATTFPVTLIGKGLSSFGSAALEALPLGPLSTVEYSVNGKIIIEPNQVGLR